MAMTLSQLRTFLAVADAGSVRVAAELLLVSQPAVSAAIASLERELGVALVARSGRGLRLTAAGLAFADDVRASLGRLDQGSRRARSIEDPARGTVRLVAVATAAERLLLPVVARFREDHPEAGVTIQVGNRMTVWDTLRHHEADLVLAGRPPVTVEADTLARGENRLVLIGPAATARRNGPGAGAVGDPARKTWLLREPGSGTRAAADALLAELDIDPPTMILGSNAAIERGVELGLGVGLISLDAAAEPISRGSVTVWPCPGTPIDRPWHLVCSGEPLGPTALALVKSMVGPGGILKPTADGRRILRRAEGLQQARREAPIQPAPSN